MSVVLCLLVTFDEIKVLSIYVDGFIDMMKCMTCSGLDSGYNFTEIMHSQLCRKTAQMMMLSKLC